MSDEEQKSAAFPSDSPLTWALGGDPMDTHLQSEIECSYGLIVKAFGKPNRDSSASEKCDAQWVMRFYPFGQEFTRVLMMGNDDGLVATIYNYKDGKRYLGRKGQPVSAIRNWHIGGKQSDVVGYIASMLLHAAST